MLFINHVILLSGAIIRFASAVAVGDLNAPEGFSVLSQENYENGTVTFYGLTSELANRDVEHAAHPAAVAAPDSAVEERASCGDNGPLECLIFGVKTTVAACDNLINYLSEKRAVLVLTARSVCLQLAPPQYSQCCVQWEASGLLTTYGDLINGARAISSGCTVKSMNLTPFTSGLANNAKLQGVCTRQCLTAELDPNSFCNRD